MMETIFISPTVVSERNLAPFIADLVVVSGQTEVYQDLAFAERTKQSPDLDAIDGNPDTYWYGSPSGGYIDYMLTFTDFHSVEGFEIVPAVLNDLGTPEPGVTNNHSIQLIVWNGVKWETLTSQSVVYHDGQMIPYHIDPPIEISSLLIRIPYPPDPLALREVRIFESPALPTPPGATFTPTPIISTVTPKIGA